MNMHNRYVTMVTKNGDVGIFKISFLEMNGQSVVDLNTKKACQIELSFKSNKFSNFDISAMATN